MHRSTVLAYFKRLKSIRSIDPELNALNWHEHQPCRTIRIGSQAILITQPSSSILVYSLGVLALVVGLYLLEIRSGESSVFWWGVALLLWGLGALLAGTSYQAFGFQIKCVGQEACAWTSWWELAYLMLQYLSINALLIAAAYSYTTGALRSGLIAFAVAGALLYVILCFIGGLIPIKILISFEFMVTVSIPAYFVILLLPALHYRQTGDPMDLYRLLAWIWLLLIMLAYWLYDRAGITTKLWRGGEGIWFSQNDVLHSGLILWMLYVALIVADQVRDFGVY